MMTVIKSPLKYQGSKLKLIPWIKETIQLNDNETWVEPFMGSGVVGINMNQPKTVMCDINEHVVQLFNDISQKQNIYLIKDALIEDSIKLKEQGEEFYYQQRRNFNELPVSDLLLFLNHTCYNGVMRFNSKGKYNVPFGKNVNKLSETYIDDIVSRLWEINKRTTDDWHFFSDIYQNVINDYHNKSNSFIYCDPPYINRNNNYVDSWNEDNEHELFEMLKETKGRFALSTWLEAKGEQNPYIEKLWKRFNIYDTEHRYSVGQRKDNRYSVKEALICNF